MDQAAQVPATAQGRAVSSRPGSQTRVDRDKLGALAVKAGMPADTVRRLRAQLGDELAVINTIVKSVTAFMTNPKLAAKLKGKPPSLRDLMDPNADIPISVWGYRSGKRTLVAVMPREEIDKVRRTLYQNIRLKTRSAYLQNGDQSAEAPKYVIMLPLLNYQINPARRALEDSILTCHETMPGEPALRLELEFIGVDIDLDEVLTKEETPAPVTQAK